MAIIQESKVKLQMLGEKGIKRIYREALKIPEHAGMRVDNAELGIWVVTKESYATKRIMGLCGQKNLFNPKGGLS